MFIYLFLFILLLVFCCKFDLKSNDNKNKSRPFFFLCFILSIVAGIRYHIGSDTANYMEEFVEIPTINLFFSSIDIKELSQPLWYIFNSICKTIIDDFILVQLIHSFIVNFLIGRFIYKSCQKPFIALLAYLCCCWWNFNFEIMRESLCISIYLNLIYSYTQSNNIKRFIYCSIPLMFIHYFAFIPIVLTFILHYVKYKPFLYIGMFSTLFLYFKLSEDLLMEYMLLVEGAMEGDAIERAMTYLESDKYGFIPSSIIGIAFAFVTKIAYSFIISYDKNIVNRIAKLLLLYGFILILRLKLLILVRFVNYWQIILIVYAINYIIAKKKSALVFYVKAIFVYNIYLGIDSFLTPISSDKSKYDSRYIPYASYFDKTINPQRESLFY